MCLKTIGKVGGSLLMGGVMRRAGLGGVLGKAAGSLIGPTRIEDMVARNQRGF